MGKGRGRGWGGVGVVSFGFLTSRQSQRITSGFMTYSIFVHTSSKLESLNHKYVGFTVAA